MLDRIKQSISKNWYILFQLVSRDFKLKYRRSTLGVLWSVLNPLLMMVVLTAVFSFVFRFDIENFPLYLILGNTLFALMSEATTTSMNSILESAPLIKKIRIDKLIFPLEKAVSALVNFIISLIAVAAVVAYFRVIPTAYILFLPLLLLYVFIFSLGVGLLLAALSVFFRDVLHLWGVIITAWTYATPLFYPITMLQDWMIQIMNFNPMYHYVTYFRDIVMWGINPGLTENLICFGFAAVMLVIGVFAFRKLEHKFILYV